MLSSSGKKRGVMYKRVSTEDQRDNYSFPRQQKLLREKMKNDDVEEVHEPIEDVESGRDFERKGLKELFELATEKRIDYVYVLDLDRLGRHVAETPYLMYRLKEEGVIVRDPYEEYNFNDPIDYVIVTIKCYRGHSESLKIGERTQGGKIEKFSQGKWVGPVPLGFRKNAEGALEKNLEFEPIVNDIFKKYKITHDIKKTTQLINEAYLGKIGKLSTNQVKTILKNPIYDGRPRYGKTQIQAPQLAMVPHDLYVEVQSLMESKASRHKAKERKKSRTILDKFASEYGLDHVMVVFKLLKPICPRCGSLMDGNGSKPYEDIRLPNFVCTNRECRYQRTIPSIHELKHLRQKLLSCPKCRVVEDFVKTETLDGSVEYTCRRCGASFEFATKRENEKSNESPSNQTSEDHSNPEQPLTPKDWANSFDLLGHPITDKEAARTNKPQPKIRESGRKGQLAGQGKTLDEFWSKPDKADIKS